MITNFPDILRALHLLSKDQLDEVIKNANALKQFTGPSPIRPTKNAPLNNATTDALRCLADTLQHLGVDFIPVSALDKRVTKSFEAKLAGVHKFVNKACPTRNQRNALLRLGIVLLYDDLVRMGIAVSPFLMMAQFHRIPSLINREAPGYANSGLLHALVTRSMK